MITFSNFLRFLKSVLQGRKIPVAEPCSDAWFIGSYYHFLFSHVEQPLTRAMGWAPQLLCRSSLTGHSMFCYLVCLAVRFLFSFYEPIHIRWLCVWAWGLSRKEVRPAWSFLETACTLCGYLKNTCSKASMWLFHGPVPWDSLAPTFSCILVKSSVYFCTVSFFACLKDLR